MRHITPALVALAVAQGCSNTPQKPPEPDPVRYGIDRRASSEYQERRLAGAAYAKEGYRHMLVYGDRSYHAGNTTTAAAQSGNSAGGGSGSGGSGSDDGHAGGATGGRSGDSATAAEARALWERYCDAGEDTTDEQFARLDALKAEHPMPEDLAADCAPPK